MQEIRLEGNIGQDAQIMTTNSGKQFATFSLGCNEKTGKKLPDGKDEYMTVWYKVFCKPEDAYFLTKGKRVYVVGKPKFSAYTNNNNQTVCSCSVSLANIYFSMPRQKQQAEQPQQFQQVQQPMQQQYQYQQPPQQLNNPAIQTLQQEMDAYQVLDDDPNLPF